MERLTRKKAILITIDLWEWLAETGEIGKGHWLTSKGYRFLSDCPLCEYNDRARNRIGSDSCGCCPYYQEFGDCLEARTPYESWVDAYLAGEKGREQRKQYASEFCDRLKIVLEKHSERTRG